MSIPRDLLRICLGNSSVARCHLAIRREFFWHMGHSLSHNSSITVLFLLRSISWWSYIIAEPKLAPLTLCAFSPGRDPQPNTRTQIFCCPNICCRQADQSDWIIIFSFQYCREEDKFKETQKISRPSMQELKTFACCCKTDSPLAHPWKA